MELLLIFKASFEAIFTNTFIAICGYLLAKFDYINKSTSDNLAKLNAQFLLPVMLFIKLSKSLSYDNVKGYWPIPLLFIIISGISLILTHLLSKLIWYQTEYLYNFSLIAASFPNTNAIPTGVIHVLCWSSSADWLKWGELDSNGAMDARGLSYIIIYTAFANLARWSYGIKLFELPKAGEREGLLGNNNNDIDNCQSSKLTKLHVKLKPFLTPPLLGIYASILLILIPSLKNLLFSEFFIFKAMQNGLNYLGDCSIPLVLLNLGCQFYFVNERENGRTIEIPTKMLCLLRFLLIPSLTLLILYLIKPYYELGNDPIFQLTILLMTSGPPALDLIQMTAVTNTYREEVALLLPYTYLLAIPFLTSTVSLYLYLIPKWYN